jgi:hypothetical protein
VSRAWILMYLGFTCSWLQLMRGYLPRRSFFGRVEGLLDFVVAWAWDVELYSCVPLLGILLFDQISVVVLFVSEDIIMGRDRGRVGLLVPLDLLPLRLGRCFLAVDPFWVVDVLAWSRGDGLVLQVFVIESFNFGSESVLRLNDSYPELFKTIH